MQVDVTAFPNMESGEMVRYVVKRAITEESWYIPGGKTPGDKQPEWQLGDMRLRFPVNQWQAFTPKLEVRPVQFTEPCATDGEISAADCAISTDSCEGGIRAADCVVHRRQITHTQLGVFWGEDSVNTQQDLQLDLSECVCVYWYLHLSAFLSVQNDCSSKGARLPLLLHIRH
jgi:hypothetical protein